MEKQHSTQSICDIYASFYQNQNVEDLLKINNLRTFSLTQRPDGLQPTKKTFEYEGGPDEFYKENFDSKEVEVLEKMLNSGPVTYRLKTNKWGFDIITQGQSMKLEEKITVAGPEKVSLLARIHANYLVEDNIEK